MYELGRIHVKVILKLVVLILCMPSNSFTNIQIHIYRECSNLFFIISGENTINGDHSDAHMSTLSQSSKEDHSISEGSPKKDKKKKKGLRTPSFLKKKKEKKIRET